MSTPHKVGRTGPSSPSIPCTLLVATIAKYKGDLIVPSGLNIIKKGEPEFTTWLKVEAGKTYDKYGELAG